MSSHPCRTGPHIHSKACRRLFVSTTALALVLAVAGGPCALAQTVDLENDTNPSNPGVIDGSVELRIGDSSDGALTIEDGGSLTNAGGFIGYGGGSRGAATVSGNLSTWTNMGDLVVGQSGIGTLLVDQGGAVINNGDGYIGATSGTNADPNTVTVTGNGSTWSNGGQLYVGDAGVATLDILDGGSVENGIGLVGNQNGGDGRVTVSGYGSTWTNHSVAVIGKEGTGTLLVEGGGLVKSVQGAIGGNTSAAATGNGTVTVSGTDGLGHASTWDTGNIYVGFTGSGTFTIADGGAVTSDAGGGAAATGYIGYTGTGTGSVTVSSSTADVSTWTLTNDIRVGLDGSGTLNIAKGGRVHVGSSVTLASSSGSNGTLNILGDASGRGILETGAVVRGAGTTAILNLNGGILRATRAEADFLNGFGALTVGTEGAWFDTNTHDITVATVFAGLSSINKLGDGTLTLTGDSATFAGTTTIAGGTLQLGDGGATGSIPGNVANDGTLAFNRSNDVIFSGRISGSGAAIQAGTGRTTLTANNIHTGGTTISAGILQLGNGGTTGSVVGDVINNGSLVFDRSDNIVFNGTVSGSGSVVKNGAGVLDVTADNSYLGATSVNAGTLLVNGNQSAATGLTTVNGGATLGGSGTLGGDVTIANGGILAPGNSPGTLTINGSLSLAAGSVLSYQFGQANVPGGALNDLVNVGGNLILDGTLNVSVSPGGAFGSGICRVFNYNGTLTDNGLALGSMPSGGDVFVQTSVDHQVNLVNTAGLELRFWDGFAGPKNDGTIDGGAGIWHLGGADDNWTEATGAINAPYRNGSFAVFAGTSGTVTVDNGGGAVTVSGMQFATDGYVVTGDALTLVGPQSTIRVGDGTAAGAGYIATIDAQLIGNSQLLKTDLGTLVLTGANSYTGGTAIDGGTVRIASDANLGDAAGGLSFDGGTLNTSADLSSSRSVSLPGAGTFQTDAGTTATFTGAMSGAGSLTKSGGGTLVLAGNATQSGGTTVSAGTLQIGNGGTSGSLQGNVTNNGTLAFNRSDSITFGGTIAGSGSLSQIGTGTTVLTADNSYGGGTTIAAGTLRLGSGGTSGSITGNVFNNGTLAFDRSNAVTFGGEISGAGGLAQLGTGITTLTGTSSYTGSTDVFAGTLAVNGSIAGSAVLVHNGGTLSGSGTVGATTVATGGTIAPGNGIGTISVNGDYVQQAGSTYRVDVNPTSTASDRIAVTGVATLAAGATVNVFKTVSAPYVAGTRYTILTTTGGLSGTFDLAGETDLTAFIRLTDDYDANSAYLVTEQSRSIGSIGGTPNQIATGTGLESLPASDPVRTALLNLPDVGSAHHALDQLSGEIHASVQTTTIEYSHFVRDAATDRVRDAFCGVAAKSENHAEDTQERDRPRLPADCGAAPDRLVAWGQAFGSWGHTDTDGNSARLERSIGGFIAGADAPVFDTWRFGVLAGYGSGHSRIGDRSSSATTDEYHLGVYGGTQWERIGFRTGATYTWQSIGTRRSANFSGFSDSLSADYHTGVTQVFGDLGYRIDVDRVALEPFANLAYVSLDTDSFTERGGAAALTSRGSTTDTVFTTFGLRASTAFELGDVDVLARGSIGWRHAFADATPISTHAFGGGSFFDIAGVPIARNAAVIGLGLDFSIGPNATLGLSYGGQISGSIIDQSARGTFSLKF